MNILIASANGYGNAGDDMCALMAQTLVKQVTRRNKVKVTAPPFDIKLADWADAFILGGGGIIYDANKENMENYLAYIDYGLKHNKMTIGIGLGEQGIVTKAGEQRYKQAFNKMDLLTVRSTLDAERLSQFGVKNAEASQDLAFSYNYHHYRVTAHYNRMIRSAVPWGVKPRLGVVLSNQEHLVTDLKLAFSKEEKVNALHFKNSFEKNLKQISKFYKVTIITQSRDDLTMAKTYAREYGAKVYSYKNEFDLHKLLRIYAKQDLILTQRFHGIVFSFMLDIPVIALGYYGQKQYKLLKDMKLQSKLVSYHTPDKLNKLLYDMGSQPKNMDRYVINLNEKNQQFIKSSTAINTQRLSQTLN